MKYNKKLCLSPLFIAIAMSSFSPVYALEVPMNNEDINIRWDNTFRYNYAHRIEAQDEALLKNPNFDDGNRNFDKGMVSNRLDILSELDVVYQNKHGVRLSMAGWYDDAYNQGFDNKNVATSNHLEDGKAAIGVPNFVERYYQGPSGEILDAFVFTNVELAEMPINIKAGRHTVYWGESLLFSGALHGVSYGQAAVDAAKGFAVPGTEVKELFRPLNQISAQMRIKPDLSLAMQYFFDWERYRLPDSGTYLGFNDALHESGESLISSGARLVRGEDSAPSGKGDMGLALRWSPEFLDGSVGFYVRRFSDTLPQLHVRPAVAALPAANCAALGFVTLPTGACYINPSAASPTDLAAGRIGTYHLAYGDEVDLLGFSLAKGIAGVSVGIDLSYRKNMPLTSDIVNILPTQLIAATGNKAAINYVPTDGETGGARGDTLHGVVNLLGVVGTTPMWNQLTWATELTWNRWQKVTQNEAVFKGRDNYSVMVDGVPSTLDKVSKDFFGIAANVTPMWYQVLPAVDLYLPLSVSVGLSGNSAVSLGGNEKSGTYSIGVGADIQQRYRVDLKFIDFLGEYQTNAAGMVQISNGNPTQLKDRGMVTLTFKTTL
ncbi:MAG TPA: DUF1302 domain-containing protein [Agitococcus sp.]|nr:DUF1302 domain-containing protein [Agitococcus sp.]